MKHRKHKNSSYQKHEKILINQFGVVASQTILSRWLTVIDQQRVQGFCIRIIMILAWKPGVSCLLPWHPSFLAGPGNLLCHDWFDSVLMPKLREKTASPAVRKKAPSLSTDTAPLDSFSSFRVLAFEFRWPRWKMWKYAWVFWLLTSCMTYSACVEGSGDVRITNSAIADCTVR